MQWINPKVGQERAPNKPMHPTPLRVDKIGRILQSGSVITAPPTYYGGAGDGQGVGPPHYKPYRSMA
jgi:hypothetical protein